MGVDSHLLCLNGTANRDRIIHVNSRNKWAILKRAFTPNWEFGIRKFAIDDIGIDIFSDVSAKPRDLWRTIPPDTDIVQLNWTSHLVDWADFFRVVPDFPIVWRFADLNPMTGGCHYPDSCNGFVDCCQGCPQISSAKAKQRIASNFRLKEECIGRIPSDRMTIVSQSQWMDSQVADSPIFERFPRVFIPNGVDRGVFRPLNNYFCRTLLGIPESGPVALIFGGDGTARRKGASQVLDRLNRMVKLPFHLLIVGESTHEIARRPEVTTTENLPPSVLSIAYSAANLMLFPSLQDNCPNSVLESQACGVPVLAFENSGTKELIEIETNGWLVRDRDFDAFVQVAADLLTGGNMPSIELVQGGVCEFTEMINQYALLYREITSNCATKLPGTRKLKFRS